jgi:hypothetical protein
MDMRDDTWFSVSSASHAEAINGRNVDIVAWRDDYDDGNRKTREVPSDFRYGLDFVLREFRA